MDMLLSTLPLPFRLRTEKRMTDEELIRFSRLNRPLHMEQEADGEIVVMTPAGFGGGRVTQRINRFLDEWAERDGRGVTTGAETGYRMPNGSMRAPDAAWLSERRVAALTEREKAGYPPLCPEFIVEVRSPSDRMEDQRAKMQEWMANGAELGWLFDLDTRSVEIYRPGESPEALHDPSSVQGSGPVAGFELVLSRVW
jgi:Uma2 family endonuclease